MDGQEMDEPAGESDLTSGPSTSRAKESEELIRCEECYECLPLSDYRQHLLREHPQTSAKESAPTTPAPSESCVGTEEEDDKRPTAQKRKYKKRKGQFGSRASRTKSKSTTPETPATSTTSEKKIQIRRRRKDEVGTRNRIPKKNVASKTGAADKPGDNSGHLATDLADIDESGPSGSQVVDLESLSQLSTVAVVGEVSETNVSTDAASANDVQIESFSDFSTEGMVGGRTASCTDVLKYTPVTKQSNFSTESLAGPSTAGQITGDALSQVSLSSDEDEIDKTDQVQTKTPPIRMSTGKEVYSNLHENEYLSIMDIEDAVSQINLSSDEDEIDKTDQVQTGTQPIRMSIGKEVYSNLHENEYLSIMNIEEEIEDADSNRFWATLFDEPEFSTSTPPSQEIQPSVPVNIELLAETLSTMVTEKAWVIDNTNDMCRLSLLGPFANATVNKGICWKNNKAEMFINNRPLPSTSFLWGKDLSNPNNVISVANYIWRLALVLYGTNICPGVEDYQEYWKTEHKDGFVESEIYHGKKCFRSHSCTLAITRSVRCKSCTSLRETFRKRKWKAENLKGTDTSKITNVSMTREQLEEKASELQEIKKAQKKVIARLKEKIRKMIEKDSIEIDQHLGMDFLTILRSCAGKMTDIQKLFWKEQLKAISRQDNPTSMTWNPMMIRIALHLQSISPATLEYMKDAGFIKMPCKRTLYDFTHFVDNEEGVQYEILNLLEKKVNDLTIPDSKKYFNLIFDEITIKSDLVRNRHGELIGYLKLTEVETSLSNLENSMSSEVDAQLPKKPQLAKKVLAYMLQGINIKIHEVVGLFSTTDVTAMQIYSRTWDVIYHLEAMNLKIICLVCDGAGANKKFFTMHKKWDESVPYVYATKNLYSGENRPIFFIVDPPHLLKTIRNCLSNSFSHFHSREMWKNNQVLSWKALEKLYQVDVENEHKIHKLSKAHVQLTSFTRMRVSLATQALSQSVATSLTKYCNDPRFEGIISSELIKFIEKCNRLFDCLNGSDDTEGTRNKVNSDLLPYSSCEDERFDFLNSILIYFQDWEKEAMSMEGKSLEEQRRRQISRESFESLHITIYGFSCAVKYILQNTEIKSVCAKDMNQDKLEQEFGLFRMGFGANMHPTLQQLIQKVLSNYVQRSAALPVNRGNTAGKRKVLQVDESPLPKRPKK